MLLLVFSDDAGSRAGMSLLEGGGGVDGAVSLLVGGGDGGCWVGGWVEVRGAFMRAQMSSMLAVTAEVVDDGFL